MDPVKMGKFIAELRKEKGLSQKDIANQFGINDSSVSKWERGINAPDIYYLGPLSELLGVSIKELLNGERKKPKKQKVRNQKKVLELKEVEKKFKKKVVLKNISMTIYEGEIVGLVGPNGAGKTTLLKSILNLYHISKGEIIVMGRNMHSDFEDAISKIGSLVDGPSSYSYLTGMENMKVMALLNHQKDLRYALALVEKFKLNNVIHKKVKTYSLGMKQRLGLVLALMKKPKILLLDEPMNGLDPLGMKELRELLKEISQKEKISIIMSSHILSEMENVCDRIIILDNGYIIDDLEIEEMQNQDKTLEEEFFTLTSGSTNQIGGEV